MRPAAPSAARTAATRAQSAARSDRTSATFTLAVVQPDATTSSAATSGGTTGTVTLTGIRLRTGSGQFRDALSIAARSHGPAGPVVVVAKRCELRPAGGAVQQHAFPDA